MSGTFWSSVLRGSNRVNRGGSWNNSARNSRSANRNNNTPANRNDNCGFRLAFYSALGFIARRSTDEIPPRELCLRAK
ncbi:MAG: SUMF1/EgtB/PvdO family nonheme iron enzyme [Deltaproteobacteria bacterium]|nr:SUMF1/EgtB/PvdO family nonheme iron enzyme [Deltaproteobacteria bacterium]